MRKDLTIEELDSQHVELLPTRETLSANFANVWASNSSMALNAASVAAIAKSAAVQTIYVNQS